MIRRCILTASLLLLVLFSAGLQAQTPVQLPACLLGTDEGTVGVPYYCDYGTALNQLFEPFFQAGTGLTIAFTFSTTAGSTLPPGMSVTQSGVFSGTPTSPGTFAFSIDITFNISFSGQTINQTLL